MVSAPLAPSSLQANMERSSRRGSFAASLKRKGSSKGVDLQWDGSQTLSSGDSFSLEPYANMDGSAPSDFTDSTFGGMYGDGYATGESATRGSTPNGKPAKPPRRTKGAPYLSSEEGTLRSSAPSAGYDSETPVTWSSRAAVAAALAASDADAGGEEQQPSPRSQRKQKLESRTADFEEEC